MLIYLITKGFICYIKPGTLNLPIRVVFDTYRQYRQTVVSCFCKEVVL